MSGTTDDSRVEQPNPTFLDQLLPPGPGPVDLLALGHQDRRAPATRGPSGSGNRLGPRISHDPQRVGAVVFEGLDHGPSAGIGFDRLEDAVREQCDPLEGLVAAAPRPGIGPLGPGDLIRDQTVPAGLEARSQGPQPGEVVWPEVGEAEREYHGWTSDSFRVASGWPPSMPAPELRLVGPRLKCRVFADRRHATP